MSEERTELREGDVVGYQPNHYHCHEGTAIVRRRKNGSLFLRDTFWGMSDDKVVEPVAFEVLFNLNDYEITTRSCWERYATADRAVVTHQHGIQREYYTRKSASEDPDTIVENARVELAEAEDQVRGAVRHRDACQRLLDHLLAEVES